MKTWMLMLPSKPGSRSMTRSSVLTLGGSSGALLAFLVTLTTLECGTRAGHAAVAMLCALPADLAEACRLHARPADLAKACRLHA